MVAVPLFPSLVAVIVAEPLPAPVARPLPPTVTAELLLAHVTARPGSTGPGESAPARRRAGGGGRGRRPGGRRASQAGGAARRGGGAGRRRGRVGGTRR